MEYRELKNGYKASLLGYGCMRFPVLENGEIDEAKAEALLDKAYASGVTYFDTAYPYHNGKSEKFTGKVLSKYDRKTFTLATKLPCWLIKEKADAERIFKEQLESLRTDYVDFYLLHALNKGSYMQMKELGVVDLIAEKKKQGLIKNFGFSFHDGFEAFETIINDRDDWDFCQIQFNYVDKDSQATLKGVELAKSKGIPLVIMEPVKGGSLASIPRDIIAPMDAFRTGMSPAAWALSWVASFDAVKVILSGMTEMDQLDDNLNTFNNFKALSKAEMDAMDKVTEKINNRVMNGCTGCRYCMPCPMGINIPFNFAIWNNYHKYMNVKDVEWRWKTTPEKDKPYACIKCGKCESACPQKLNIREDLVKVGEEMKQLFGC